MKRTEDLTCLTCDKAFDVQRERLLCDCGGPLEVVYRHDVAPPRPERGLREGVWRWHDVLPSVPRNARVSLGEGDTPLVELPAISAWLGCTILLKDEGANPGGSFKARGASVAVSVLSQLGWKALAMPTVGSGGSAWSAYGTRAKMDVQVGIPSSLGIPEIGRVEPALYGARISGFPGSLRESFAAFRSTVDDSEVAFVGAFQEPYRVEGEKTILFEIVEQLGWTTPDVVVWPTGGAAGLVGLVKAREELDRLNWLSEPRATMVVAAQHDTGGPLAEALRHGASEIVETLPGGIAPGVWVGSPFAGDSILRRVRRSGSSSGVLVGDAEITAALRRAAREDGVLLSPEGALALAAAKRGRDEGVIRRGSTVVCINTASPYRYPTVLHSLNEAADLAG